MPLELARSLTSGACWKCANWVPGKGVHGSVHGDTVHKVKEMQRLATEYSWLPYKALVLEKAPCATETGCWKSHLHLQKLATHAHQNQEAKPFLSALFLQHALQAKFNVKWQSKNTPRVQMHV